MVKGYRKLSQGRPKNGKVGGNPSPFFRGLKAPQSTSVTVSGCSLHLYKICCVRECPILLLISKR
jgi:hypothetical protein